jgi:hypothetical protein
MVSGLPAKLSGLSLQKTRILKAAAHQREHLGVWKYPLAILVYEESCKAGLRNALLIGSLKNCQVLLNYAFI